MSCARQLFGALFMILRIGCLMEYRRLLRCTGVLVLLFVAGCATTWVHPYKGQQDFHADAAYCESMGRSGGGNPQIMPSNDAFSSGWNQGAAIASAGASRRISENCMYGKGWRPAGVDESVPALDAAEIEQERADHQRRADLVKQRAAEQKERDYQQFESQVRQQVPDYDLLTNDENIAELDAFIEMQKPSLRRAYRLTVESGTVDEVVDLLNEFKAYKVAQAAK